VIKKLFSIAKLIDHSLLHPQLTDFNLREGCFLAKNYNVAAVCIKPYAVPMAKEVLCDSEVRVGTVIGFPHGSNHIDIKIKEAEKAFYDGAEELDMVINIGKVLSKDWVYISNEIKEINKLVFENGGVLKIIFENDFLVDDYYKVKLCEICNTFSVGYVKTSTGYGFVKQENGFYNYSGATDHDLVLMRRECIKSIEIKAAGGIRTLDDVLRVKDLGVTRIGASATKNILEEAKDRGYQ
jgi:deoxyribose-phosphate aldolase